MSATQARPTGEGVGDSDPAAATPMTPINPGPFQKAVAGPITVTATVQSMSEGTVATGHASAAPPLQHPDLSSQAAPSYAVESGGTMVRLDIKISRSIPFF